MSRICLIWLFVKAWITSSLMRQFLVVTNIRDNIPQTCQNVFLRNEKNSNHSKCLTNQTFCKMIYFHPVNTFLSLVRKALRIVFAYSRLYRLVSALHLGVLQSQCYRVDSRITRMFFISGVQWVQGQKNKLWKERIFKSSNDQQQLRWQHYRPQRTLGVYPNSSWTTQGPE